MRRAVLAAALGVILGAAPVHAGPQDVATQVAHEIMSPFCPGVTLHDCPSGQADEMRREIVGMAETGMSKDAIIDALEREYGPLRATPGSPAARALPLFVALGGALIAGTLLRRWTRRPPLPAPALGADDRLRIEQELDRFRSGSS